MISNLTCQHCGKTFEAEIVDKTEFCPHCGRETAVHPVAVAPESSAPAISVQPSLSRAQRAAGTVDGLRDQAATVVNVAIVALVLAGVAILVTFIAAQDVSDETMRRYWSNGLSLAGSLCSLSVALYVIAQIIHIRANTLK